MNKEKQIQEVIMKTKTRNNRRFFSLAALMLAFTIFGSYTYAEEPKNNESIEIQIEAWMLDENYFAEAIEVESAIEDWMLSDDYYNEVESSEVEDWMLSDTYFNESPEEASEIEDWMLNENYFESAEECDVELEDWMFDQNYFTK